MDHIDDVDVEALPRGDSNGESSTSSPAIEEQQQPRFSRRKKIVAAVVTIAAVAAVAIGVALSTGGGKSTSMEQAGVVQNDNQGMLVVVEGEPSATAVAVEPSDEEATVEVEEPQAPAEDSTELPSNENETPQEEEEEDKVLIIDDETLDIIMEMGYEQPAPVIPALRPVAENVHETTEEKIAFNSEDFAIEAFDYEGPTSDFISTDLARITSVTTSSTCKNSNEGVWKMALLTDAYPWETFWNMTNSKGEVVAFGPPTGYNYARNTNYIGQLCLPKGRYALNFGDKNNDGNCCTYGNGKMTVKVNGKTKAETDDSDFSLNQYSYYIGAQQTDPKPNPTTKPSKKPTKKPANKPSKRPTKKPSPSSPTPGIVPAGFICVDIDVRTDQWADETSYKFVKLSTQEVLLERKRGSLTNDKLYSDQLCVEPGRYRLTVDDNFKGLQKDGYYAVRVDGQEVMFGTTFPNQEKTASHIIHVGFKPTITNREQEWLDAHNNRRQVFHTEKLGAGSYRPLVWNTELAQAADEWIDQITPLCKIKQKDGLVEGENISSHGTKGENDEGPEVILARWADNKILHNVTYPKNQSMTQVYWRGTRYVGCAEKWVYRTNENGLDKTRRCYVSICRYARAGNCGVNENDWLADTLKDRSTCGPVCPSNVCY